MFCGLHGGWCGRQIDGSTWWGEWAMGTTKFNDTWWVRGHGMFGAHEVKGLLWTWVPFSRNCLLLQGSFKFTKLITQYKTKQKKKKTFQGIFCYCIMPRPNFNFVIGLCVMITKLLDSTRLKHSNTKILYYELFLQLQIGPTF